MNERDRARPPTSTPASVSTTPRRVTLLRGVLAVLPLLPALTACSSEAALRGARDARSDIAIESPAIRLSDATGIGRTIAVDPSTGLPVEDRTPHCGFGVDFAALEDEVESYNAVVREAAANGELGAARCGHLIRTRAELEDLLRRAPWTLLGIDQGAVRSADDRFRASIRGDRASDDFGRLVITDSHRGREHMSVGAFRSAFACILDDSRTLVVQEAPFVTLYDLHSGRPFQREFVGDRIDEHR